ncbi:hypothetical protein SAMN02982929_02280 [Saccharopolyspora kobensis]|uniref:GAF domain-containing protein n=1 Tax=Saccharopolyspora kobensis TaxID=146035 RepID=A0A1H6AFU4_9PSEU|nr:GAF domain-containing protein [Saccharopolyspora kobensis]SEG46937.1 hypothetical protein SAMN02982929_02280 [Saccharopolyspora kobensis]SFE55411.1 GAF domain-containing protein [Saccharopolyspora kobensis]
MDAHRTRSGRRSASAELLLRGLLSELLVAVPGAGMGGISCAAPARLFLHTDERAGRIDAGQLRDGTGPCPEAMRTRSAVLADVTEIRTWWPGFARAAREARVFSFLVVPLIGEPQLRAAVSLYGQRSHAFADADVPTALNAVAQLRKQLCELLRDGSGRAALARETAATPLRRHRPQRRTS